MPIANLSTVPLEVSLNGRDYSADGLGYTYAHQPMISVVSPSLGPTLGATVVEIRGAHFSWERAAGRIQCRFEAGGKSLNVDVLTGRSCCDQAVATSATSSITTSIGTSVATPISPTAASTLAPPFSSPVTTTAIPAAADTTATLTSATRHFRSTSTPFAAAPEPPTVATSVAATVTATAVSAIPTTVTATITATAVSTITATATAITTAAASATVSAAFSAALCLRMHLRRDHTMPPSPPMRRSSSRT